MSTMPSMVQFGPHEVSTKTDIGKEIWSHERKADYDPRNHPYPKMLYKAYKGEDGRVRCMDTHPKAWAYPNQEMYRMACEAVDQFNLSCQKTVANPEEHKQAAENGWRESPKEASDQVFAWEREITKAAAHRNYEDRNLSEKARAEVAAAEAETPDQVPEIKEKPKVKLDGRSKKAKALKAAAGA